MCILDPNSFISGLGKLFLILLLCFHHVVSRDLVYQSVSSEKNIFKAACKICVFYVSINMYIDEMIHKLPDCGLMNEWKI